MAHVIATIPTLNQPTTADPCPCDIEHDPYRVCEAAQYNGCDRPHRHTECEVVRGTQYWFCGAECRREWWREFGSGLEAEIRW